jgi:hypothetical protein
MPAAGFQGLKKLQQRYLFCTSPNGLKFHGELFWNIKKILGQRSTVGGKLVPIQHQGACPYAVWGRWPTFGPLLLVYKSFYPKTFMGRL